MEVGSFEAKTKFASLLDRVERGEEVVITRRGRAVARLIPAESDLQRANERARAVEDIRVFGEKFRGRGITLQEIQEWIAEGRR